MSASGASGHRISREILLVLGIVVLFLSAGVFWFWTDTWSNPGGPDCTHSPCPVSFWMTPSVSFTLVATAAALFGGGLLLVVLGATRRS